MSGPSWKVPAGQNDWIGEKILAEEDATMAALAVAHSESLSRGASEPTPPPIADIPIDPAAEQAAFADLLKFFADNPEDDCEVTALSPADFAAETFTPPNTDSEEQNP